MANQTPALVEQAKALGIDVDGRWGDDTIQQRIDAAIAAQADGADPVKDQMEALTDGEGDPATSGEAGPETVHPDELAAAGAGPAEGETGSVGAAASPPETTGGEPDPADAPRGDGDKLGLVGVADDGEKEITPSAPEPDTKDDDLNAAQAAMTAPIWAAYDAATVVYRVLQKGDDLDAGIDTNWMPGDDLDDKVIVLVRYAAPFVRTYPDAPVEALYGQVASDGGKNLVLERPFETLPLPERLAWRVFRDTLLSIDREAAAERARALDGAEREPRRVPIDETTLETVDDPLEASEIGGGRR